ncbi:hypothetical protein COOONC_09667 [Cooperia oncophora]
MMILVVKAVMGRATAARLTSILEACIIILKPSCLTSHHFLFLLKFVLNWAVTAGVLTVEQMEVINDWRNEYHAEEAKASARLYGRPYLRVISVDPVDYECDQLLVRLDEVGVPSDSSRERTKKANEKDESVGEAAGKTPTIPLHQSQTRGGKTPAGKKTFTPKPSQTPVRQTPAGKKTPTPLNAAKIEQLKKPKPQDLDQEKTQEASGDEGKRAELKKRKEKGSLEDTEPSSRAEAGAKAEPKPVHSERAKEALAKLKATSPRIKTQSTKLSRKKKMRAGKTGTSSIVSKSMASDDNPDNPKSIFYPFKKDKK